MFKLYNLFLLAFIVALSPAMHAGEIDQKKMQASAPKSSHSYQLDLQGLSARLVCDISQCSVDEEHQWPFCDSKIRHSIKAFQDTCFRELQKLYVQWEQTHLLLQGNYHASEILAKEKSKDHTVSLMVNCYLPGTRAIQSTRCRVYNKIIAAYQILCDHDVPQRTINLSFLTLDKFPDLRRSLITPTLQGQVMASFSTKRPRRSSSV